RHRGRGAEDRRGEIPRAGRDRQAELPSVEAARGRRNHARREAGRPLRSPRGEDMRSAAQIKDHPLHPILIVFPIAFGVGAPLADIAGLLGAWPTGWAAGAYLATEAVLGRVFAG